MKKRVRRTKEEARRLILDATEQLVKEHGPNGLRVSEVAEQVGMHETNIFHHFGSREGLLGALVVRAIDDGVTRALRAIGESLGASQDGREEAFAKVFDVIQEEGTGKLYSWLILAGMMNESQSPDLQRLIPAMRAWRSATFEERLVEQPDTELRSVVMLMAIFWLGESVGGEFLARAVGYEDPKEAVVRHRRWISHVVISWMEHEAQGRSIDAAEC